MAEVKKSGRIGWLIVAGLVVVAAFWFLGARNRLVRQDEQVDAAWSEIENQLQRRSDLIPNLVATVRGFASQESEVLATVSNARARLAGAQGVQESAAADNELSGALSRLLVVVEAYPDLRSNQNFIRLQDELAGTENRIAVARQRYNDSVRAFNSAVRSIPTSSIATTLGLMQREYFEVAPAAREVPQVNFGSGN